MLHVYTGDGKGKTTAALGLAIRAAGAGLRVACIWFDKGFNGENEHYSERRLLRQLDDIDLFPTGCERILPGDKFRLGNTSQDIDEAQGALRISHDCINSGKYRVIIIDEICTAASTELINQDDLMEVVATYRKQDKDMLELILTGHHASTELIEAADLVSNISMIKHYYNKGLKAREGIDY
jgi:cob(I)alamin adenosyltransferase